jgi:hypothetical protein
MVEEPSRGQLMPDGVSDDQVKALMDDLDSSIASFDERLRAYEADAPIIPGLRRSTELQFPSIALDAQRGSRQRPTAASIPAEGERKDVVAHVPAMDLLSELAHSAEEHAQDKIVASRAQQEVEQRFDRVLRTIFDYLHQFTQHVNVIKPAIPLTYVLDPQHRFGALQWSEGFVDYRTRSKSEVALIETVSVRLRYSTSALEVNRTAERASALRDELHLLNLTITDETKIDLRGLGSGIRFVVAGSIPVQVNFRSDMETRRIVVRGRNIGALGLSAYVIELEQLSRTALDGLGLNLLGRSTRLSGEFVPVAFRTRD